jgi:hypothetical protein
MNLVLIFSILSLFVNAAVVFILTRYHKRVSDIYEKISATNRITQDTLRESDEANKVILSNLYSAQLVSISIKDSLKALEVQLETKYKKNQLLFGITENDIKKKYQENRKF